MQVWNSRVSEQVQHLRQLVNVASFHTIRDLCAALARSRNRPILLYPMSLPPNETASWLGMTSLDVIFHAANAPQTLIDHAVLHEIGHMLFEHTPKRGISDIFAAWLASRGDIPYNLPEITMLLQHDRSHYEEQEEYEAELFASLVEVEEHWGEASEQQSELLEETVEAREVRLRLDTWVHSVRRDMWE